MGIKPDLALKVIKKFSPIDISWMDDPEYLEQLRKAEMVGLNNFDEMINNKRLLSGGLIKKLMLEVLQNPQLDPSTNLPNKLNDIDKKSIFKKVEKELFVDSVAPGLNYEMNEITAQYIPLKLHHEMSNLAIKKNPGYKFVRKKIKKVIFLDGESQAVTETPFQYIIDPTKLSAEPFDMNQFPTSTDTNNFMRNQEWLNHLTNKHNLNFHQLRRALLKKKELEQS